MHKEKKVQVVDYYTSILQNSQIVCLCNYSGISVQDIETLRSEVRKAGGETIVIKNTLMKIAADNMKIQNLDGVFKKPIVIITATEPVAISKVVCDFEKKLDGFQPYVAIFEGKIEEKKLINTFSNIPSMEQVKAKIVASLLTPARNLLSLVQGRPKSLVQVIDAYSKKNS